MSKRFAIAAAAREAERTGQLSDRALNRALLARQGLLERFDEPVVRVVEAIGAMQGQAWPALAVGLWSRMTSFVPDDLYAGLSAGELLWGIGLRGTLHLVSAREHPAYAVVAAGVSASWHRAIGETTRGMDELRAAVLSFAADSRTNNEIRDFAEAWVAEHLDAIDPEEVDAQRRVGWRPIYRWSALTRVPNGGVWGTKAPPDHLAVAIPPASELAPSVDQAIEDVARRHLRAFTRRATSRSARRSSSTAWSPARGRASFDVGRRRSRCGRSPSSRRPSRPS